MKSLFQWLRPLLTKADYEVYKYNLGLHRPVEKRISQLKITIQDFEDGQTRLAFYTLMYELYLDSQDKNVRSVAEWVRLVRKIRLPRNNQERKQDSGQ